jgi:hypothetical protein
VTENEPFELMLPGCAFVVEPETIVIGSGLNVASETPFAVAFAKLTVPKDASGRTPLRLDGASAITSADASAADLRRCVVENVQCCVESEMVNVKRPTPSVVTDALNASPAWTGLLRFVGNFGYISYQA